MTPETMRQYQAEEWALIYRRMRQALSTLRALLDVMEKDHLAPVENVQLLRTDLAKHYKNEEFLNAANMGQLLRMSLNQVHVLAGEAQDNLL